LRDLVALEHGESGVIAALSAVSVVLESMDRGLHSRPAMTRTTRMSALFKGQETSMKNALWTAAALLLATACGPTSIIGTGPCEGPSPAASCGVSCADEGDCDYGFYCNAQYECYAECTPGGGQCADGYSCDLNGRCQPSGTGPDDSCPRVAVRVEQVTPTVQLLIDQSGSMAEQFGNTTRWRALRTALVSQGGIIAQLQDKVIFGATLYSSIGGDAGGTCPLLEKAPPALGNLDAIYDLMYANQPRRDTPTAESIIAVTNTFPPVDPDAPGPRIIVLATDGNPDNCVDPDAHDLSSQILSENAAQAAYAQGIDMYILSVGDEVSVPHLQRMANAGRGLPLDTGDAPFYVANDPAELVDAFQQIIGGAQTCTFAVDGNVTNPDSGIVKLNGVTLDYGTDWIMSNQTTLELLGAACDTFLYAQDATLTADFACGAVVL
jgi:hypothetical protein